MSNILFPFFSSPPHIIPSFFDTQANALPQVKLVFTAFNTGLWWAF